MPITRNFTLYLNAGISVAPTVHVNQYDRGEQWVFTLLDDKGQKYTPSSGALIGVKADGNAIAGVTGTVGSNGDVYITETQQMTAAAGKAIFELTIDGQTHGTANFIVQVEKKPTDDAVLSESDLSIIQQGIDSVTPAAINETVSEYLAEHMTNPPIDPTLTVSNAAADAKVTGDKITDLKNAVDQINTRIIKTITPTWEQGAIDSAGHVVTNTSLKYTSTPIPVVKYHTYNIEDDKLIYRIKFYANDPTIGTTYPTSQTSDTQTTYTAENDGWIAIVVYNANIGDVVDNLPQSVTLYSLDEREKTSESRLNAVENDVADLENEYEAENIKNPVSFTNATCFKASNALGACTVGQPVSFTANSSRNVCRLKIYDTVKAVIVLYAVGASQIACVVTDENDSVLKVYTATETTRTWMRITWSDVSNAKYIYWTSLSGKNSKALYEKNGDYVICHGDRIAASVTPASACGELIENKNAMLSIINSTDNIIEITYPEQDGDFTVGLWVKMPNYDDVSKISSILINVFMAGGSQIHNTSFSANFLQSTEWAFIKLPMINGNVTHARIKLTFTMISGYTGSIKFMTSPFIITNHYLKPTFILNQDQFWGASETCGFYDYMFNNNLPFTVTGKNSVPDPVSNEMLATLREQYEKGLLDVGVYTNESVEYPIPNNATSYIDTQNAMNHVIDDKIQDGYYPVSVGCGSQLMPPAIRRTIENSGFKAVRAGYAQGDRLGVLSNVHGMLYQTGDIISYVHWLGTVCFMFAHGYSNDPSSETTPALYSNWTGFKPRMDLAKSLVDDDIAICVNMAQWAELTKDIKLV